MWWWMKTGVVQGLCLPFPFPSAAHHRHETCSFTNVRAATPWPPGEVCACAKCQWCWLDKVKSLLLSLDSKCLVLYPSAVCSLIFHSSSLILVNLSLSGNRKTNKCCSYTARSEILRLNEKRASGWNCTPHKVYELNFMTYACPFRIL